MTGTSDEIIIVSDEDDADIQIETIISKPINTPSSSSSSSSSSLIHSKSTSTPILVLIEPKSLTYGIERGYKLKHIHGIKQCTSTKQLMYLVEYDLCDDYEFVPSDILRQYCDENFLIKYLENLTEFTD